jgi:diadenosine tetraphosphatase ApaH/serine/threonine PP2A family protein phosphatase
MRYLVISDIHANLSALRTVLDAVQHFDKIWCLGDLVGYGPDPNSCIECLRGLPLECVAGNHDWGTVGRGNLLVFHNDARQILHWTRNKLSPENYAFLSELPTTIDRGAYLLVHGSPRDPIWEYIIDVGSAKRSFLSFGFRVAFVGHTHVPVIFEYVEDEKRVELIWPSWDVPISVQGRRLIINPGSVGQPRDGDPRASYGILDTEAQTWEVHRLSYPVEDTQDRMREEGLPQRMIDRLILGR